MGSQQILPQLRPPAFIQQSALAGRSFTRPLSVIGSSIARKSIWHRSISENMCAQTRKPLDSVSSFSTTQAPTTQNAEAVLSNVQSKSMVFEIGLSFLVTHHLSIFMSVMRCLFQSFRPLLILFIFGQILKAVFFIMGAPIWFSFYSIWIFEVIYGLAQCAISFIFISFFYNNLSFARVRQPLARQMQNQRAYLARASRAFRSQSCDGMCEFL